MGSVVKNMCYSWVQFPASRSGGSNYKQLQLLGYPTPLATENTCTHMHILPLRPTYTHMTKNNKAHLLKLHFPYECIMCLCMWAAVPWLIQWRSESKFQEWALFSSYVSPGDGTQVIRLGDSTFICWAMYAGISQSMWFIQGKCIVWYVVKWSQKVTTTTTTKKDSKPPPNKTTPPNLNDRLHQSETIRVKWWDRTNQEKVSCDLPVGFI